MEHCIEKLVKFDPSTVQRPMSVEMERHNNNNSNLSDDGDDADVLIESEEIQQVNTSAAKSKKPSGTVQNDDQEKRSPWPNYKQNNAGFAATNTPNHRTGPNSKQPRLNSNAVLDKHPDVAEIIKHIEQNHLILICMRGAPGTGILSSFFLTDANWFIFQHFPFSTAFLGSGKSHLAKSLIDRTMNGDHDNHIFSTDDFFFDRRTKQYNFDRSRLGQAHESNQFRVASYN